MAIPVQLQQDIETIRLNDELKYLRGEFAGAVSKMSSGAFSIKRAFSGLSDRIIAKIDELITRVETIVVPAVQFDNYRNAVVTFDEYASFDTVKYYNELKKIRLGMYGVLVAMLLLTESSPRPLRGGMQQQGVSIDILDDTEFLDQGYTTPVFDAQYEVITYVIRDGDTLQSIAVRTLGDASRWPEIAALNTITDSDLIDGTLVGVSIKIPSTKQTTNLRSARNLVFEAVYGSTQEEVDLYFYGSDIFLFNGRFEVDGSGDLKLVEGLDCVIGNVLDRFITVRGNLNPLHPDYGVVQMSDTSNTPFVVALERLLRSMEAQAASDPRVKDARLIRKSLSISGDRLECAIEIFLIGGNTLKTTVVVPTTSR